MAKETSPANLPPSGAWSGYYMYEWSGVKHRMKLHLTFSQAGEIDGDGVDDVADFLIHGEFDVTTRAASFTKAYIAMHSVDYRGIYDHKCIQGAWRLRFTTGEFRIWPGAAEPGEQEAEHAEVEDPELVLV